MKPTVDIKDCFVYRALDGREYLSGVPVNYPESHHYRLNAVQNGHRVYTSEVVAKTDTAVTTRRTEYNILNWIDPKSL
jgi:hypothetical protein